MSNILRGIFYTGLAAAAGVVGYIAGKSKHWKGISLTTMGLALILYTPRGCDLLEKYATIRGEIAKAKIYGTARKDSLDAVLERDRERDSSARYVRNAIHEISSLETNLEDSYNTLLRTTEDNYSRLIKKNNLDYTAALKNMQKQNDALQENINALKDIQRQANAATAILQEKNTSTEKPNTDKSKSDYTAPGSNKAVLASDKNGTDKNGRQSQLASRKKVSGSYGQNTSNNGYWFH